MSNDSYCRFSTKLVLNGTTLVDGMLSVSALDMILNSVMKQSGLPFLALASLYHAPDGTHYHYDVTLNGNFIAFEMTAIGGPVEEVQQITTTKPTD